MDVGFSLPGVGQRIREEEIRAKLRHGKSQTDPARYLEVAREAAGWEREHGLQNGGQEKGCKAYFVAAKAAEERRAEEGARTCQDHEWSYASAVVEPTATPVVRECGFQGILLKGNVTRCDLAGDGQIAVNLIMQCCIASSTALHYQIELGYFIIRLTATWPIDICLTAS